MAASGVGCRAVTFGGYAFGSESTPEKKRREKFSSRFQISSSVVCNSATYHLGCKNIIMRRTVISKIIWSSRNVHFHEVIIFFLSFKYLERERLCLWRETISTPHVLKTGRTDKFVVSKFF